MKKVKFGMTTLNITQGRYCTPTHKNINAYDLAGKDSGIEEFKTFTDLTVIGVHSYEKTGFSNTVHFFDKTRNMTIALTHMNDVSQYFVGKRFNPGEVIYKEGKKGNATGNHIHMEIGKGYQTQKSKVDGNWTLLNSMNIEEYFFIDPDYTFVLNDYGYDFTLEHDNEKSNHLRLVCPNGQNVRNELVNGTIIGWIDKGQSCEVIELLEGFQKDGYQWAKVKNKGIVGYCQIDTKKFNYLIIN